MGLLMVRGVPIGGGESISTAEKNALTRNEEDGGLYVPTFEVEIETEDIDFSDFLISTTSEEEGGNLNG